LVAAALHAPAEPRGATHLRGRCWGALQEGGASATRVWRAAPVLCACGQQGLALDEVLVESCARGARCMPSCRRRRMPLLVFTTPFSTTHSPTRWSVILFRLTHPDPHPRAPPAPRSHREADTCDNSPAFHRVIFTYPQCGTDLSRTSATFEEAGWIAARPSAGQSRVSTPSAWAPLS